MEMYIANTKKYIIKAVKVAVFLMGPAYTFPQNSIVKVRGFLTSL